MSVLRRQGRYWVTGGWLACAAVVALAAEEPTATPYRPTVSNPAALSAPGYFEVEAGFQRARNDDPRRRDSLPVLFKYAFTENVGVLVGGDAFVRYRSDISGDANGIGDTNLTLKLHHAVNDQVGVGLETGIKLPTAKDLIGSGKHDVFLVGIVSAEVGTATLDVNLGATRLGAVNPGESRTTWSWAASLSHPLGDKWGIAGEVAGVQQHGAPDTAQFLAAVSYNASKTVVLDAGTAWGLTRASPDRTVFAGVTVLLK